MSLNELLDRIRQEFLNAYHAAIEVRAALPGNSLILEPALRQQDDTLAIEGELQLPIRTDIAILEHDIIVDMLNVEADCMLGFDPVDFEWSENLHVNLGPFAWQGLALRVRGAATYDWEPLQDWFWKWFRDDEEDPASETDDDAPRGPRGVGPANSKNNFSAYSCFSRCTGQCRSYRNVWPGEGLHDFDHRNGANRPIRRHGV